MTQDEPVGVVADGRQYFVQIVLEDALAGIHWSWIRDAWGSSWQMDKPVKWPANPFVIDQLLAGLELFPRSAIKRDTMISEVNPEKKRKLSFFSKSGEVSFEFTADEIGKREQQLWSPFPECWKCILDPSLKEALKTQLWDLELLRIDGILLEFAKKEKKYVFLRKEGLWILENTSLKLSTKKINKFLTLILALEIDQFLPEQIKNTFALGFQVPDCRLTLLCGQEPHVLEIGKSFYRKSHLRFARLMPYEVIFALPCDFLHDLFDPCAFFLEDDLGSVS
jgi:hypothetical protein